MLTCMRWIFWRWNLPGKWILQWTRWSAKSTVSKQLERKEWVICNRIHQERFAWSFYWCTEDCRGCCQTMELQDMALLSGVLDTVVCMYNSRRPLVTSFHSHGCMKYIKLRQTSSSSISKVCIYLAFFTTTHLWGKKRKRKKSLFIVCQTFT